jgi:quinol monooxygenase YgiN
MYAFTTHVSAPNEAYQAVHRAVLEVVAEQGGGDGLVLHLACATEEGFDVTEVWDSREQADAFNATVMPIAMQRAGIETDAPEPRIEELNPIGVMVPGAP